MAGDQGSDSTASQHVSPGGDAYVAGRDVHVHLPPGRAPSFTGQLGSAAVRSAGLARDIDPLELHVHLAAGAGRFNDGKLSLTPYLERDHDQSLREAIRGAAEHGPSVFAFLEGDSAVGKTRALYEAIRAVTPDWPVVWPTDGEELLNWLESGQVTSGMVLWLNESQTYFDAEVGPRAAARLDALLRSTSGIVAVGTLWRHPFLERYLQEGEQPDKHAPIRHLLMGPRAKHIVVPDHMTPQQQRAWAELAGGTGENSDHRVAAALDAAGDDGKVIQHLTGGPELLRCFRSGTGFTPVERALIRAVLDARRLGHWSPVSARVLERACDGYLSPRERPGLPDWASIALAALTTGTRADGGGVGPGRMLTALSAVRAGSGQEPGYLPDDYLDQNTRADPEAKPAPVELWDALSGSAAVPEDLERLGHSAMRQGFYWHAGRLWIKAISGGSTRYADSLVRLVARTSPADVGKVTGWVIEHGILRDPQDTADLLLALHEAAAAAAIASVLGQRPAEHADLEDAWKVAALIQTLHRLGEDAAANRLASRAASGSSIDDPDDVYRLVDVMAEIGATSAINELLKRGPERRVRLDDEFWAGQLLQTLLDIGARPAAAHLASRIADHPLTGGSGGSITLTRSIQLLCGWETAEKFAARAAADMQVSSASEAARLISALQDLGMREAVAKILERSRVDQVELDGVGSASELLQALLKARASDAAAALAARAAAQVPLQDLGSLEDLARQIYAICGPAEAKKFGARIAGNIELVNAYTVVLAINALRELGAGEYIAQLLERDLVHRIEVDDVFWCGRLLRILREAGESTAVTVLAARIAAEVPLKDTGYLSELAEEIYINCGPAVAREFGVRLAAWMLPGKTSWLAAAMELFQVLDADELVAGFLERNPAGQVSIDSAESVGELLRAARRVGASGYATELAVRAAAEVPAEELAGLSLLAEEIYITGGPSVARELGARLAAQARTHDAALLAELINFLYALDAGELIAELLERIPVQQVRMDDIHTVRELLQAVRKAGASNYAADLAARAAEQVSLDGDLPFSLDSANAEIAVCGGMTAAKKFAARVAAQADLKDMSTAADVITGLQEIFATEAIVQLLERCPVEDMQLGEPDSVTDLLLALHKAGAVNAARNLAARAAEQVHLSEPAAVIRLAEAMRDIGAVQDSLSLMRKAVRITSPHDVNYSAIQDYFTVIESAGLRVTANTLLYGPGPGAQKSRPWDWGDLLGSEQEERRR